MELSSKTAEVRERSLLWLFDISLLMKLINGTLEMLTALLIFIVPPTFILSIVEVVTAGELSRDRDDFVAMTLYDAAHALAVHPHYFLSLYLFFHGAVKVALVVGIYAKKRIAYPLFMIAIAVFATYEGYVGFTRELILLQLFAAVDFCVILLTMHEYRKRYPNQASVVSVR